MLRVFINGTQALINSADELHAALTTSLDHTSCEYTVVDGDLPTHNLSVLRNGDSAILFYTLNIDEESYTSRNTEVDEGVAETEFTLSNGQTDPYDSAFVVSVDAAFDAMCDFFQHRMLPQTIDWKREF
ncbi:hypothetical protein SH528x_003333 [Novipirellula sp. SH528]|uniref:hypothetical protein n=1 Tax=Novipirellula sp. SH528 TaxID=3454466 RepID=UPI003F9F874E